MADRIGKDSKYFVCQNGHPYATDNCGWPMLVTRCLECKEMIGGHDHKLLSTNFRVSKSDFDAMLDCLRISDDCARRTAFDSCLAFVKLGTVPARKAISPSEFDPDTLSFKNSVVFALPGIGVGVIAERGNSRVEEETPDTSSLEVHSAILCFGDSLTAGLSQRGSPPSPYSVRLAEHLADRGAAANPVINAGICGETTKDMCKRMREVLQQYDDKLAIVLILGGTNDLGDDDLTPGLTIANLQQMHSMAHTAGARTGVLTLPDCIEFSTNLVPQPYKAELDEINEALRDFASTSDSTFLVDVASALPQDRAHASLWEADGVHFTAQGYAEIGDLLGDAVLSDMQKT